jgi:hypothetical protein
MGNESSDVANLNAPLLSLSDQHEGNKDSQSRRMTLDWREDVAKRVKLFVPQEYDPYQDQESPKFCWIHLNTEFRRFVVESESTEGENVPIDIIDPEDVIGIKVEIEVLDGVLRSPRVQEEHKEDSSLSVNGEQGNRARNEPSGDTLLDTQGIAVLHIFAYPKRDLSKESILNSCGMNRKPEASRAHHLETDTEEATLSPKLGHRYQHHRQFRVAPTEDMADLSHLVQAMRKIIHPIDIMSLDDQRLLIVINPVSGKKTALSLFESVVAPMLEEASVSFDMFITSYARHAEERMQLQPANSELQDLSEYSGIVSIGGDGVLHEIMQGIHSRPDEQEILKNLKLGMIGAGTSNGLSATLAHASEEKNSTVDAAYMIAKGKTAWIDLSRYETTNKSYLSFLTYSWAYIADIDIESEAIRFMGFIRFDLWGALRVLTLRKYRAKFSYLPPTQDRTKGATLSPLNQPTSTDDGWVCCEDDFVVFWASQVHFASMVMICFLLFLRSLVVFRCMNQVTHAGEQMHQSPQCRIDDGIFNIFVVR